MASPQVENGYTRLANELLDEVLRTPLPGRHLRVWLFVVRKTYGFGKKKDRISLSQFTKSLHISRSAVCKIINDLVLWRTLVKSNGVYEINKNYEQWVVPSRTHSVVEVNRVVPSRRHTKETITKEINTAHASRALFSKNMAIRRHKEENEHYEEPSIDADNGTYRPDSLAKTYTRKDYKTPLTVELIGVLKKTRGLDFLDGSESHKVAAEVGKKMKRELEKVGEATTDARIVEGFEVLLTKVFRSNKFHYENATSMAYINRNWQKLIIAYENA